MASGSATGNPRNKVALKPGHSLMDWIRLGNSGKDLTGVNGVYINVSKAELAQHKSTKDAWLSIRGVVYNVSHYMDFHPGGCEELMRGVGTDATKLFNQVHSWVNYETILKKCVVGKLGASPTEEEMFTDFSSTTEVKPKSSSSSSLCVAAINNSVCKVDWYQQIAFLVLVFYAKSPVPKVHVSLSESDVLQCKINDYLQTIQLESKVRWPCYVSSNSNGKVQVKLIKKKPALWKAFGSVVAGEKPSDSLAVTSDCYATSTAVQSQYWPAEVTKINKVTHDTYLIKLKYTCDMYNCIPPGCHIFVRQSIKGDVTRPYTPVPLIPKTVDACSPGGWQDCSEELSLLVKSYSYGQMSSWLCSRKPGSSVQVSEPMGSFSVETLSNFSCLYLLAAGSGITPMLSLISWTLRSSSEKKVKLLFFNKTRKDIIWQKEFDDLAMENSRFSVEHILSEPDVGWSGRRGHVTLDLVQTVLPQHSSEIPRTDFVCICGPRPFTLSIEKWLKEDLAYAAENYYSFLGQ